MVIPFDAALQQAKAAHFWSPAHMADLCKVGRSTMYRWLSGESVPDLRVMVSACQVLGINPELVAEGMSVKYHDEILSLDSLQARYQEQFAIDPKIGTRTIEMAALVAFHKVIEYGVMSSFFITPNGDVTINPVSPDGAGYRLEIAVLDGRIVVAVKTNSGATLSTEVLSEGALKTAVEMIS